MHRSCLLIKSQDKRSPKCRSKSFSLCLSTLPSQSRTTCIHPELIKNYACHDDILGLDVSVKYIVLMKVLNCWADLFQLCRCLFLFEFFGFLYKRKQWPLFHVLKDQVKVLFCAKVSIKLHDVWVVDVHLNFELLNELVEHILQWFFFDLFDANQKSCLLMNCRIKLTKPAFSLNTAQLKIVQCYFLTEAAPLSRA